MTKVRAAAVAVARTSPKRRFDRLEGDLVAAGTDSNAAADGFGARQLDRRRFDLIGPEPVGENDSLAAQRPTETGARSVDDAQREARRNAGTRHPRLLHRACHAFHQGPPCFGGPSREDGATRLEDVVPGNTSS